MRAAADAHNDATGVPERAPQNAELGVPPIAGSEARYQPMRGAALAIANAPRLP